MSYEVPLINGSVRLPAQDGYGLAPVFAIRKIFAADTPGTPGDTIIYQAEAPFAMRLLDVKCFFSAAVALSTVQLRNATGGGGDAIFGAIASSATGVIPILATETATATIAAGSTLVLRRSDIGVGGEIIITVIRI